MLPDDDQFPSISDDGLLRAPSDGPATPAATLEEDPIDQDNNPLPFSPRKENSNISPDSVLDNAQELLDVPKVVHSNKRKKAAAASVTGAKKAKL